MPQTARERGVGKGAPEMRVAALASKARGEGSRINSPINTHTHSPMRWPPRVEKEHVEEKSPRRPVDKASMASVGEKHGTRGTSSQRERFSAARRASASDASAGTTASTSFRTGTIKRRASASNATTSTPASLSRAGFFGSFDDSRYWDYASRFTQRQDIGNKCRECKRPFLALNEEIVVRRGGRIELRYHKECFSMIADPRSQPSSSANVGKFVQSLKGTVAPEELYRKMRTRGHW